MTASVDQLSKLDLDLFPWNEQINCGGIADRAKFWWICTEESRGRRTGRNKLRRARWFDRRHGNKSGMNARCKDPPHSILGSHERALHMLSSTSDVQRHAIPDEPSSCCLSCAIDLLVWPALLPCSLGQTRISMSMCDTICVLRANVYHKFTTYHIQLSLRNAGRHLVVCCHNIHGTLYVPNYKPLWFFLCIDFVTYLHIHYI